MTIEEIYLKLQDVYTTTEGNPYKLRERMRELADCLLAVLPVARSAGELADIDAPTRGMSLAANAYRVIEHGRREAAVIRAVEVMRERLAAIGREDTPV